jgi:hypothetical protein
VDRARERRTATQGFDEVNASPRKTRRVRSCLGVADHDVLADVNLQIDLGIGTLDSRRCGPRRPRDGEQSRTQASNLREGVAHLVRGPLLG